MLGGILKAIMQPNVRKPTLSALAIMVLFAAFEMFSDATTELELAKAVGMAGFGIVLLVLREWSKKFDPETADQSEEELV